jgi:hypothetical protein
MNIINNDLERFVCIKYCVFYIYEVSIMFKLKKAESLSLSTVVIAALCLLVLVILSVIFVGRMGNTSEKSRDCIQQGGSCYSIDEGVTCQAHGEGLTPHPNGICQVESRGVMIADDSKICCIKI